MAQAEGFRSSKPATAHPAKSNKIAHYPPTPSPASLPSDAIFASRPAPKNTQTPTLEPAVHTPPKNSTASAAAYRLQYRKPLKPTSISTSSNFGFAKSFSEIPDTGVSVVMEPDFALRVFQKQTDNFYGYQFKPGQ